METLGIDGSLSCGDIEVASLLLAKNYKLLRVEKSGDKSIFCFESKFGIEKEIKSFYLGELKINARAFSNARKNLKSIIYANKNIH